VGKTELAKTLALELFHSTKSVIRIDMSKYREFDSIARLLGVSPIKNNFSIAQLLGVSPIKNDFSIARLIGASSGKSDM
jgi:ATP-dependent Clp protease ATP-binding subunit ClpE